MRFLLLFCLLSARLAVFSQTPAANFPATVPLEWNKLLLEIDRYGNGFRPAPISVAMAYLGLAGYETCVPGMPGFNSLENSLPGLNLPDPQAGAPYHFPAAVNAAYSNLMTRFFQYLSATQPTRFSKIETLRVQFHNQFAGQISPAMLSQSENWGNSIADALWIWLQTDPIASTSWPNPQPTSYVPPAGPGLWQPTFPDFGRAVSPFHGTARLMAMSQNEKLAQPPLPYSETPGSPFYEEARQVFEAVNDIKNNVPAAYEQKWIAEYWSDDITGVTFSPPARGISVANQMIVLENLNLAKSIEMYAKLGVASNDAAIAVWHSKYVYNVERPVSFIRRVMSQQIPAAASWTTNLNNPISGAQGVTPAFPAYPSGHSGFGGVMSGIFSSLFENTPEHPGNYIFTDKSHEGRTDFIGTSRTFTSFRQHGVENAESRIPLGVHFKMDCEEGLRLGELAAQRVLQLPWKSQAVSCTNISINSGAGNITVAGLNAPISQIQIFNSTWQRVFNCAGNCAANSQTINDLPAGNYFVKVNFYTSNWQPICEKEQFIQVSGGGCTVPPTVICKNISKNLPSGGGSVSIAAADVVASSTAGCGTLTTTVSPNSFSAAGTFPVLVTVTNSAGLSANCTSQVTISTSGGGVNCSNISIAPGSGKIDIGGLTAPVSQIQVFNSTWQRVFNCSGDCSVNTHTINNLTAGKYFVKVNFYTSNWQPICEKEQFVNVSGSSGGTNCDQISVVPGAGNLKINGLTAPISQIQIFNSTWQRVFNCAGDCAANSQTINNLTPGNYFVKVNFYTSNWQPICEKEQFIAVSANRLAEADELVFNVKKSGNAAVLQWISNPKSPDETRDYFVIERSGLLQNDKLADKNFEPILKIDARGTSGEVLYFSENDDRPLDGSNFYRLKMVNRDGSEVFSKIENLDFPNFDKIRIFPNPASERFFVNLSPLENREIALNLSSMDGRKIKNWNLTASREPFEIEILDVPSGVYFLKIETAGERDVVLKVAVQK